MLSSLIFTLTGLLPLFAFSAPTLLSERAGGPIRQPIPADCTITYPRPQNLQSYQPSPDFVSKYAIYKYLVYSSDTTGTETEYQSCLESCYGYGLRGDCLSVFLAENVTTEVYGTNATGTLCQFFSKPLKDGSFVKPEVDGSYVNPKAAVISCPK